MALVKMTIILESDEGNVKEYAYQNPKKMSYLLQCMQDYKEQEKKKWEEFQIPVKEQIPTNEEKAA